MTNAYSMLFRAFASSIFLYAGSKHVLSPDAIQKKLSSSTAYSMFNSPLLFEAAVIIAGILMLAGGAALMLGYRTRIAAALLLSVLIPITLTVQLENLNDLGPFFKNVAISGSLLFILKSKKHEEQIISPAPAGITGRPLVARANNKSTR